MGHSVEITAVEMNYLYFFLTMIVGLLGWLVRQQLKWMHTVDEKITQLRIDQVVIKTTLGIREHNPQKSS